ncbi:hypothetical protein [Thermospira aquatica]|uniref:Uncharacterized protein n=1 Tax=Thermospira aquatica TaxID=2828656 RepID=A0AAX3BI83_9SPIR|nr:hypothetical protein [Thermospira aquatica]URA11071.1 hypothetical protein KDW03_04540 [Thermospira aquatica]
MEFLSTFFYEAMIRISSTFLFDATGFLTERTITLGKKNLKGIVRISKKE